MAYTRGTRYRDGCAGGERGSTTAARAVCAEVLQVVHGAFVRLAHVGGCAMVAEDKKILPRFLIIFIGLIEPVFLFHFFL